MKREEPKQSPKEEDPKSRAQMEREDLKGGGAEMKREEPKGEPKWRGRTPKGGGPEMKRGAQRRTQKEEEEPKSRA